MRRKKKSWEIKKKVHSLTLIEDEKIDEKDEEFFLSKRNKNNKRIKRINYNRELGKIGYQYLDYDRVANSNLHNISVNIFKTAFHFFSHCGLAIHIYI